MKKKIGELIDGIKDIDEQISSYAVYSDSFRNAIETIEKEIEFEFYLA